MPPLAIVAGYGLARLSTLDLSRRRRLLAVVAIASVVLAAGLFVFFVFALAPINHALGLDGLLIALALAAGPIAMYWLGREPARIPYAIAALALAMLATVPLAARARRDASPLATYRDLATAVQPYLAGNCTLASYRHYVQSLPFYTGARETRVEYWGELSEVAPPAPGKSSFILGSEARLRQAWSFWLMHGFDCQPTRPQCARRFAEARAGDRMRGQEVRALQRHMLPPPPGAASCLESRFGSTGGESRHLDSVAPVCTFGGEG